ncbi:protein TORNADO 2-like [Magnolia sinica]|uniref:protein TORNADO 2-like n=1 Tax=Magnolia sinica TaxID=86752 RepID=UPI002658C6D6|nr:protein TORNADO 2-like [Magnolia sinica]
MPLISNVIAAIYFVVMLLSIPIIGAGIWLASKPDNACMKLLQWPVIIIGILILIVAFAGFVGEFWGIPWLKLFCMIGMLIFIILLPALVVFIFTVTNNESNHTVPGRAFLEYRLDDYSGWMRRRVRGSFKWDRIRNCIASTGMCAELHQSYRFAQDFFNARISPLQSGCCKPPTLCGYTFVNPTYWISPTNTTTDMDCLLWRSEQTQLCHACESCKAGLLANLRKEWRRADLILVLKLVALIGVIFVQCFLASIYPLLPLVRNSQAVGSLYMYFQPRALVGKVPTSVSKVAGSVYMYFQPRPLVRKVSSLVSKVVGSVYMYFQR